MFKIKLLIKTINVIRIVWASKKLAEKLIDVKKDFCKEELDKRALAIGRWELYKQTFYGELIHTGLFNKDVEHVLYQHILKDMRVKSNVCGLDMTGNEMLELYGRMMSECQRAIKENKKITDFYPLPKIED